MSVSMNAYNDNTDDITDQLTNINDINNKNNMYGALANLQILFNSTLSSDALINSVWEAEQRPYSPF